MKRLFLLVAMLGLVCGSCDKNSNEAPNNGGGTQPPVYDQALEEATLAIDQLIAEGKDFVAEEVSWTADWYLDALMEYNEDFTKVTKIHSALGGEPWSETYEPVFYVRDNYVKRIALTEEFTIDDSQRGVFDYYYRIKTIYIDMPANEDYEEVAFEAKVMAVTSDYVVLEWTANEVNYRGVVKPVDLRIMECRSAELQVGRVIAEMGEFDKSKVEELILGKWVGETLLDYEDETYQQVWRVESLFGMPYMEPQASFCDTYIFNVENVEIHHTYDSVDSFDTITDINTYDWSYDKEKGEISLSGSDFVTEIKLLAINDKAMYWQFGWCRNNSDVVNCYSILGFRRVN